MKRSIAIALTVALCLSCSYASDIIVANTSSETLSIRAEFRHNFDPPGDLPIRFADVGAMGRYDAWHEAPPDAVTIDAGDGHVVHVALPPRTAARLASASNCHDPTTCDRFYLTSIELSGARGSIRMEDAALHAAFARESRYRWVMWYPLSGVHGFWKNLGAVQAARLGLTMCTVAFALWAAALVARTPMPKRWGWAALALLGLGKFAMNWTTGETTASFLSLPVLVGSIGRGDILGPWIVAFSLPAGAIVALLRRQYVLQVQRNPAVKQRRSEGVDA